MTLRTRALVIVLLLVFPVALLAAEARGASKVFVIGFLAVVSAQPVDSAHSD